MSGAIGPPSAAETASRYVVAEWYGNDRSELASSGQDDLLRRASGDQPRPPCPFQRGRPACSKPDGVCSIQLVTNDGERVGGPVIACSHRFEEGETILHWLAEVVGLPVGRVEAARDVPFTSPSDSSSPAGKFEVVVADGGSRTSWWPHLKWFPLELQAVAVTSSGGTLEPQDSASGTLDPIDRDWKPDWHLSRVGCLHRINERALMVLRWGSRQVIVVDSAFFDAIGGPSDSPQQNHRAGEVLWLVPRLVESGNRGFTLSRGHWEALDILESTRKLVPPGILSDHYLDSLIAKLEPLG